jgi:hypothetical protein
LPLVSMAMHKLSPTLSNIHHAWLFQVSGILQSMHSTV